MSLRKGVRLRPTVEREELYERVKELRGEGLAYNQIIRRIQDEKGITLRKSHLSDWLNGRHRPFGYVRPLDENPSSELTYVIGAGLGDGSTSSNRNHSHMIKLRVKDREFAQEFSRCLGVLLDRTPPRVKWDESTGSWSTQVSSLLLKNLLGQDLSRLAATIRHCDRCQAAFLRGFFDSEASVYGRALRVYNGDLRKLELVRQLATSLGVETTGPHLRMMSGGTVLIKGREWRVNSNSYYLYVRAESLGTFNERIGFTLARKRERLLEALGLRLERAEMQQKQPSHSD